MLPAGSITVEFSIVKENSATNNTNNAQENISVNDFLECIEIILRYILSQNRRKNKQKWQVWNGRVISFSNSFLDIRLSSFVFCVNIQSTKSKQKWKKQSSH